MNTIYEPQWRDANGEIRYPFVDDATLLDADGRLFLTNDWLVDAAIYSPIAESPISISQISIRESEAKIYVTDGLGRPVGTGTADRLSASPIVVLDDDGQAVATLVPGDLLNTPLFVAGDGDYLFVGQALEFVQSTVVQNVLGAVQGFRVGERLYTGSRLVLIGEHGVHLTLSETDEITSSGKLAVSLIRVHALGDPQYLSRECDDAARRPSRFIREIVFQYNDFTHVCHPDANGNILLLSGSPAVEDSALRVQNREGEIEVLLAARSL